MRGAHGIQSLYGERHKGENKSWAKGLRLTGIIYPFNEIPQRGTQIGTLLLISQEVPDSQSLSDSHLSP